ncbi:hypothetical protein DPMN_097119 [Dreissena polymorpha]|uniref:Uncharacterized protein n=1 Tax=Dreissena polymorpha TaxID=45954 RepID=A0A9D4LCN7_DREPO|nr:hypothetical protein DPMN_097119 [Dreissena polymorpha]
MCFMNLIYSEREGGEGGMEGWREEGRGEGGRGRGEGGREVERDGENKYKLSVP